MDTLQQEKSIPTGWIIFLLIVIIVILIFLLYMVYHYRRRTMIERLSETFGVKKRSGLQSLGKKTKQMLGKLQKQRVDFLEDLRKTSYPSKSSSRVSRLSHRSKRASKK